jgi:hypothetical protein
MRTWSLVKTDTERYELEASTARKKTSYREF